ncbi:MAG: hypothetical protein AAGP08_05855 [Pseudomonadota bacterium]
MLRIARILGAALAVLSFCSVALAQNRPSPKIQPDGLYFLSVGIGEYLQGTGDELLDSAENSAERVAEALMDAGADYGIVLRSRIIDGQLRNAVTRDDILNAIFDLKARIRADGAQAPRIVVYAMGHGYGDPQLNMLFLQPGDVNVPPELRGQMGVSRLVQQTVWNIDLVAAMITFRVHPSMDYMDRFLPTKIMPDLTNPMSGLSVARFAMEMQTAEEQRRRAGAFPPEGNPPVPYILLLDNCFNSIKRDLVVDAGPVASLIQATLDTTINEGLVYYAAPPGEERNPVPLPDALGGGQVGPLGLRLVSALRDLATPATLSEVEQSLLSVDTVASYRVGDPLVADVARTVFFSNRGGDGILDRRFGSGQQITN